MTRSRMMTAVAAGLGALLVVAAGPGPARAPRPTAFDEGLRQAGPVPRPPLGDVQPDGSVRYGPVTVSIKNPCPPGTADYEPPLLPGRRARK